MNRRILAVAAALIGVVLVTAADRTPEEEERIRASRMKWEKHYYDRVEQFQKANAGAKNIVIVGSSHIEGFDTDRYLPGRRIINRGIGSDRIGITERGILHRLDESVFDCNPGFIVLENGVNDLGELWRNGTPSLDEIEACYRRVVVTIRDRLPDVPLLIVGLFPTRDRYAELNENIVAFNRRLEAIASDHGCQFMDVFTPFADDAGQLRKEFSVEGLHLTEAGYAQWAKQLKEILPKPVFVGTAGTSTPAKLSKIRGDVRVTLAGVVAGTAFLKPREGVSEPEYGSSATAYIEAIILVERLSSTTGGRDREIVFAGPEGVIKGRTTASTVKVYDAEVKASLGSSLVQLPPVGKDAIDAMVCTARESGIALASLPERVTITASYFGETFVFKDIPLP